MAKIAKCFGPAVAPRRANERRHHAGSIGSGGRSSTMHRDLAENPGIRVAQVTAGTRCYTIALWSAPRCAVPPSMPPSTA